MGSWLADYNSMVLELTKHAEVCEIFRAGLTDFGALGGNDQMRFHGWMISHLLNAQNLFLEANEGTMHPDLAAQVLTCNAKMLGTAGGHAWWSTARPTFHTEFTNHMEHLIDREAPIGEMWPWFLSEGEARS